jgi:hypothetical protein
MLLKTYQTESVCCSLVGDIDEQTWRDRSWFFVEAIAQLESDIVNRFEFLDLGCKHLQISSFI